MQTSERSYRCSYFPTDRDSFPVPADTGVLTFVQVQARNAEQAQRTAHAVTGCPIAEVQRLDPVEFSPPTDSVFAVLADAHERAQARRFAA